ncbi:oligosaccharide flippase family protein [Shewanella baltica]|uniref:oligosaccharide flippase family protein n=1 Tax=Shewanella baltica TaxID=62322 RepID=UPI003D79E184
MVKLNSSLTDVKSEKIASGILYSTLRIFFSIIIPFLMIPMYAKAFGVELLGVFNLSLSVVNSALVLGTFGLTIYSIKESGINNYSDSKLGGKAIDVIKIRLLFTFLFLMALCGGGYLFGDFDSTITLSILLLSFSVFGEILSNDWLFIYFKQQKTLFVRGVILKVLLLLAMYFLIDDSNDYFTFLILYSSANFILCFVFLYKSVDLRSVDWFCVPDFSIIYKALPILGLTLASSFYGKFDSVILGYVLSKFDYGIYSAAYKLIQVALVIITSWAVVLLPYVGQGGNSFAKYLKFTYITSLLVSLFIFHNAEIIIANLYGEDFMLSVILMKYMSLIIPIISVYNYMIYQNSNKILLKKNVFWFLLFVGFNIFFIFIFRHSMNPMVFVYLTIFFNIFILLSVVYYTKINVFCKSTVQLSLSTFAVCFLYYTFFCFLNGSDVYLLIIAQVTFLVPVFFILLVILKVVDKKWIKVLFWRLRAR